jgi:hypothetical protein
MQFSSAELARAAGGNADASLLLQVLAGRTPV